MVDPETNSRDRGQVILIGAITLAFIVLGIVIVFNGILYTDGLSAGTSSQTATDTQISETEIRQGVACLLVEANKRSEWEENENSAEDEIAENLEEFADSYGNAKSHSTPSVISLEHKSTDTNGEGENTELGSVTVAVTYDSHDLSYDTEIEIEPSDCPNPGENES